MATRRSKQPAASQRGAPITIPIRFALQGVLESPAAPSATRGGLAATPRALPAELPRGTLMHSVRVQAATQRAAGAATVRVEAVPGRDVVVLRLQGGPTLVLHPENARDLMLAQQETHPAARGGPGSKGDEVLVEVPASLRWRSLEAAASVAGPAGL